MKQVQKKSADPAVNQLLVQAYRRQVTVTWDRAEAMQPQCGFSRLGLCCHQCAAGPCRISPFDQTGERTICGRSQDDLVAAALIEQATAGVRSLSQLVGEFGGQVSPQTQQAALRGDDLCDLSVLAQRLPGLGQAALAALQALSGAIPSPREPQGTTANFGALQANQANIVLLGHVPPAAAAYLQQAADGSAQLLAMPGNESLVGAALPILTNYDSQELALLTGAVDLLVYGSQCVLPATRQLAAELGIAALPAGDLRTLAAAQQAVEAALSHQLARRGQSTCIPASNQRLQTGHTLANSPTVWDGLVAGYRQGQLRGLAYLGGCGNIAHTQDADLVALAKQLLQAGYLVVTAGCAGTALAKAGLCDPAQQRLPGSDLPAVLHLGACHLAYRFLEMAGRLRQAGVPSIAVFSELVQHKQLATALAFAADDVAVFADLDWAFGNAEVAATLRRLAGAGIHPVPDWRQPPAAWPEVAAGK